MHPQPTDEALAARTLANLEAVVAVDSQSDERSPGIPTTAGQVALAELVADYHARLGAAVERDAMANVIASYRGRGRGADRAPVALMVHLDTARGTAAVPSLHVHRGWRGEALRFPANPDIRVDVATYPSLAPFVGHDVVHGPGDRPFGLDDKLGLAHCMTLAALLEQHAEDRPPLVFVGRPDEEVGRHEAVVGLAALLQERGVRWAYTVDGILPYEVNVENFNAAMTSVTFAPRPGRGLRGAGFVAQVGGVNTHGATAAAEGHRAAPRLVAEWRAALAPADAEILGFESDELRDCDARVALRVADGAEARVRAALEAVMAPHRPRGASWSLTPSSAALADDGAAEAMLAWISRFLASRPGFTLPAEDSSDRDGYSQPMRARTLAAGIQLDVRLRDFNKDTLARRVEHVRGLAGDNAFNRIDQYVNMGPELAAHPGLADAAERAGQAAGVATRRLPIRGGTGVDVFLERGIPVANLGTGYFAPESEKELTSLQLMAGHARWLLALARELAEGGPAAT
ncbi:MAG: hypothetical protein JNL82_27675 [Myxococcales bacterium]|nr:hypothetical protein [Myxococcales bacterium]